jgi:hypothetical protein
MGTTALLIFYHSRACCLFSGYFIYRSAFFTLYLYGKPRSFCFADIMKRDDEIHNKPQK